jgi:hypothetical protein
MHVHLVEERKVSESDCFFFLHIQEPGQQNGHSFMNGPNFVTECLKKLDSKMTLSTHPVITSVQRKAPAKELSQPNSNQLHAQIDHYKGTGKAL